MEGTLVSAAGGALKPVLEKMGALLSDKYKLFKSVRSEIKSLKAELEAMHAFHENMSELEDSNVQDKAWMADVRELSYDIEDSIDEFMLRVDDKSAKPDGFIEKCKNLLMKTKTRHQIANACRVHDTILDFIISKSVEENFVTIFGAGYEMPGSCEKVRCLSLHGSHNREEIVSFLTKLNFSQARSLILLKYFVELASLLHMRFLRVMDLGDCYNLQGHHLANIGNLFRLKYLSLRNTGVSELPAQIGKLQYLETMDVRGTDVLELPATVIQLQRLIHLAIDVSVTLPDGIGSMTALEQLKCVNIFRQSIKCLQELGQLKHLRNVRLFKSSQDPRGSLYKEYMDTIVSSLCKLGTYDLHSVSIDTYSRYAEDFSLDLWGCTPCGLRKFVMDNFVPKVPNWMGSLVNLQRLTLYVKEFEVEDLLALGRLPALEYLLMLVHESFEGRKVTISGNDGFQYLRRFGFGCAIPVMFEAGDMPKVETLDPLFKLEKTQLLVSNSDLSFGFQHLSSLHMVICSIHYDEFKAESTTNEILDTFLALEATEDAIKRALSSHPKFPEL